MVRQSLRLLALLVACIAFLSPERASAQMQIGTCYDQSRGQAFAVFQNLWMVQMGNPANQGPAVRDPSGMTFMRIPAANPMVQAFFVDWSGRVVEINPRGMFPIGYCQFQGAFIPPNPFNIQYQPPQMANWGVRMPDGNIQALPQAFAAPDLRYAQPLYATAETAQNCMSQSGGDHDQFADCMVRAMVGPRERAVYDCARSSQDTTAAALCTLGAVGGPNEQRAAGQISNCYSQHGTDWEQYPLCMASQNMNDDAARLLSCVRSESEEGSVSFFGTAVCYGAGRLNLTPEQQIAIECAATSGGEPLQFAGCTGGRLTAREITKCFEIGIGGDGCFGPNNEIVRAFRSVGVDLNNVLGPNNDLVRNWNNTVNDLNRGPGPNNEVVRAFRTIGNDLAHGPGPNNDIVRAVDRVIPGFSSLF